MSLCKPYAKEEVADALFQIGPQKAPAWMASPSASSRENGTHFGKM